MGKTDSLKKDFIWNTLGSAVYSLSSLVLSFAAMRILGGNDGGIFAFGFSTFGQHMFIIAYFGMRPFHITDVKGEYSYGDYEKSRIKTVLLAGAFSLIFLAVLYALGRYTFEKALCILSLAIYKILDGFADCAECECQRKGVLWRGGRELALRSAVCALVLLSGLILTKDILIPALTADAVSLIIILIFRARLKKDGILYDEKEGAGDRLLLRNTCLLFLGVFLDFFIFSSSKYAIDLKLTDTESGIFNILFMPTNIIYLAANFIMKPFLTPLAADYESGDEKAFSKKKRMLTFMITGFTVVCAAAAVFLGRPALSVCEKITALSAGTLTGHQGELVLIMAGGGLYALANLFYYILVIERRQKAIFTVYFTVSAIAAVLSVFLTGRYGLTGAACSYTALMSVLAFIFNIIS